MSVVLIVVDSLRKASLQPGAGFPHTPFLDSLRSTSVSFERAYATECWTLPTHLSIFTGLLPSEHGAHFQSMAYRGSAPTIAEILAQQGYFTEVITRNSIFDGTMPGVLRGFASHREPMAPIEAGALPLLATLALAKPRVRRLIRESGFFHSLQKRNREFLTRLVRMGLPADRLALELALERMAEKRGQGRPYFLFLNLYDVHAPYCPSETSPIPRLDSWRSIRDAASLPRVLPKIGSHAYLRPGFRISETHRQMLLGRYHRAIELMDAKLERFVGDAERAGLLDDTLLVITSDHGEAFGEHDLYLHDASVYETHLHVPLWVRHPDLEPRSVDDVVSTRDLFGLICSVGLGGGTSRTLLDPAHREARPYALAEHFHYPHVESILPRYRQNLTAAVTRDRKIVSRDDRLEVYDLRRDPNETDPESESLSQLKGILAKLPASLQEQIAGHLMQATFSRAREAA